MTGDSMAAYFAAAAAFYRGDVDVGVFGALEDDRQRAGLDFYQRLVAAGVPRVLGHLFPVTNPEAGNLQAGNLQAGNPEAANYRMTRPRQ